MCMIDLIKFRFKNCETYDDVILKLDKVSNEGKGTSYSVQAQKIISKLQIMCPDSLHKTVKLLSLGERMASLAKCLTMELAASRYFLCGKTFDYGVTSKLVEKVKHISDWPESIDPEGHDDFLSKHIDIAGEIKEEPQKSQELPCSWTLPSEKEIKRLLSRYNGSKHQAKQQLFDQYSPYKLAINEYLDMMIAYIEQNNKL